MTYTEDDVSGLINQIKVRDHENIKLKQELETTKKLLGDLQVFLHRFQEEFYLNNSSMGLTKLYADIVEYDLAKLSKEGRHEL